MSLETIKQYIDRVEILQGKPQRIPDHFEFLDRHDAVQLGLVTQLILAKSRLNEICDAA